MALKEYKPGTTFTGRMGRAVGESKPAWPAPLRAKEGAPNVLFIALDDTGFGQLGCYGSPINTPNINRLAENGFCYANMHTTALCSPTRSFIITGRNRHSNAMAGITEGSTGYPGYNGNVPFDNGFLSEMLLQRDADSKRLAPNKPFFLYFCAGAMRAPHHLLKEWADNYKGKFDDGWD